MRPADADDRPAVAELFRARSVWMRNRGLEGWQGWGASAEELAVQAGDPDSAKVGPVWVLTHDDGIVGVTTLYEQTPLWGWTDAERAEPAIFLATTCTDPAFAGKRLGCLIAWWALGHASERGFAWVRRGCGYEQLMRYYRELYQAHRGRFTLAGPQDIRSGDPSALTQSEQATVDAVLASYGDKSAHWLSELTHHEAPWWNARQGAGLGDRDRGDAVISLNDMFEYYDGLTRADAEAL